MSQEAVASPRPTVVLFLFFCLSFPQGICFFYWFCRCLFSSEYQCVFRALWVMAVAIPLSTKYARRHPTSQRNGFTTVNPSMRWP